MNYDTVTVRALRVEQIPGVPLYSFFMRGGDILRLGDFSRLRRNDEGQLEGFQRAEVKKHVAEIKKYLDGPSVLFPNGIILAVSQKLRFVKSRGPGNAEDGIGEAGHLELQLAKDETSPRLAWIVDGQQRSLALSRCTNPDLPVPVCAFVSEDINLQRDQFIRVNQGKPLPKKLIDELLPEYDAILPTQLAVRKIPSYLVNWLNQEKVSPFRGMIKRCSNSGTGEKGKEPVITDNALLEAVKSSLDREHGCLAMHRNLMTGEVNIPAIGHTLVVYWSAVKKVFPNAWGLPPRQSRLMHSVGIRSMSVLMDPIMLSVEIKSPKASQQVEEHLRLIADQCAWTEGHWAKGYSWDDFQATPNDIKKLSGHLLNLYYNSRGQRV